MADKQTVENQTTKDDTTTTKNTNEDTEPQDSKCRYFRCIIDGKTFGRYTGVKPKQAANKAFTAVIRANGGSTTCINKEFKFQLVECTRGGKKSSHYYEGVRKLLDKPVKVKINNAGNPKEIVYKYTNKIKKTKQNK